MEVEGVVLVEVVEEVVVAQAQASPFPEMETWAQVQAGLEASEEAKVEVEAITQAVVQETWACWKGELACSARRHLTTWTRTATEKLLHRTLPPRSATAWSETPTSQLPSGGIAATSCPKSAPTTLLRKQLAP